jgi:enamine deaminase RidA (YjgF/YER057c/UK114 family)
MTTEREPVIPTGHEKAYKNFHFAPAMAAGNHIFVSGIIGRGHDGRVPEDPRAEADAIFASLAETLDAAGSGLDRILDLQSFHTDFATMVDFIAAKDAVISEPYPAWTAIGCAALIDPAARVELRAIALRGDGGAA